MTYLRRDHTILKRLLSFCIPIFFANFLQTFYALTDMAVVGRFVGETGLAAVANGISVAYIIGSVGAGLALGGVVVIGHYWGAGNQKGLIESIGTVLSLSFLAGVSLTPICLIVIEPALYGMNVPESALSEAVDYLSILCLGNVFLYCATSLSFVMRGLGDSRSPLYFTLFGGLINIGLDIGLVVFCGWGVKGAAWATVAAQAGALMFAIIYLKKRGFIFEFKPANFKLRPDQARLIMRIGLAAMAQLMVVNISYLMITALLNGYGAKVAAAAGVGLKICTLAVMPCWAVGQALTALSAAGLGAGKIMEVEIMTRTAIRLNLMVTALVVAAVQIWAEPLMLFFNPADPEIVGEGVLYLRVCCSLGVLVYAVMYTFGCLATGAGAAYVAMFNSLLDSIVLRLILIGLLYLAGWGLLAVYFGQAASALIPAMAGAAYFRSRKWQKQLI